MTRGEVKDNSKKLLVRSGLSQKQKLISREKKSEGGILKKQGFDVRKENPATGD